MMLYDWSIGFTTSISLLFIPTFTSEIWRLIAVGFFCRIITLCRNGFLFNNSWFFKISEEILRQDTSWTVYVMPLTIIFVDSSMVWILLQAKIFHLLRSFLTRLRTIKVSVQKCFVVMCEVDSNTTTHHHFDH